MSDANTVVVIVAGLLVGYWFVGAVIQRFWPHSEGRPAQQRNGEPTTPPPRSSGARAWHEVLGISPTSSAEEIRNAYLGLIVQYHPDKVASLGAELQTLAETKSRQITAAYNEALRMKR